MNKSLIIIMSVVLFVVGAVAGNWAIRTFLSDERSAEARGDHAMVRQQRPPFTLPDLEGQPRHAAEWDGQVLVLNFWATWCTPCRREIPAFNELQKRYAERGVQFVGVALDDPRAVRKFIEKIPIDYPVLIGEADGIELAKQYGNTDGVLPYTVFIDRAGQITSVARGALSEASADKSLQSLL